MRAFLFPGQGSQEIGMAADLFGSDAAFRQLAAHASQCAGADLERLCSRGPERELVKTEFLQPLLVAVSLGYCRQLTERGIEPDVVLGHSLGEISALAAAGVLSNEDAVSVAAQRGKFMAAAARVGGGMLAVITSEREKVLSLLADQKMLTSFPNPNLNPNPNPSQPSSPAGRETPPPGAEGLCPPAAEVLAGEAARAPASRGRVFLANDNAPNQLVFAGLNDGLEQAAQLIRQATLGTCRKLAVSGPWHTPLMEEAQSEFGAWLQSVSFRPSRVPVLMNGSAALESDPEQIRRLVIGILTQPVLWRASMERLRSMEARLLLEVGPGRVLSGLARANGFGNETRLCIVNNLRAVELAAQAGAWQSAPAETRADSRWQVDWGRDGSSL
jgi:[acyl-carrier-protein] S-malonyltransferase